LKSIPSDNQDQFLHDLIQQAARFALQAHEGQVRKVGGQPYFFHPLAVGRILLEAGMETEVVVAGILHDTVEDTDVTLSEIESHFGSRVVGWVAAVTEQDKAKPWRIRKQNYLEVLSRADYEVVMISLADKLDNLRSLLAARRTHGPAVWGKFTKPKPDQRWYYQKLLILYRERITEGPGRSMVEALQRDFQRLFDQ
jgi:(p)ppGpp synthase/HD superfamily hydrolase